MKVERKNGIWSFEITKEEILLVAVILMMITSTVTAVCLALVSINT